MNPYRYIYLGDKLTDDSLRGRLCKPIFREDGKCVVGRSPRNQLVEFVDGTQVIVLARRLRLVKHLDEVDGLPVPDELMSIADAVRYGYLEQAALKVQIREGYTDGTVPPLEQHHYDEAVRVAESTPRAIVPYAQYREARRLTKIKTAYHRAHPHHFYRYYDQRGRGARPIANWPFEEWKRDKRGKRDYLTSKLDGKGYQPCGAVPLPAPKALPLLPARVPEKPIEIRWIEPEPVYHQPMLLAI